MLTLDELGNNLQAMNPILPEEKARKACLSMMQAFEDTGYIDYDGERMVSTASLHEKGKGKVFGILITYEGTILKAFSGELNGSYLIKPFVEPVIDPVAMEKVTASFSKRMEAASKEEKTALSQKCWKEMQKLYRFHCHDGQLRALDEIAPSCPSGTGDCAGPRLLCAAYERNQQPSSLAEFFYGDGSFESGTFLPPCDSRCSPILKHIIGLDIVYLDDEIIVVNKPEGLLSIPGKGPEKADCVASRVRHHLRHVIAQPCVHRLDQATSGLMVLGLTDKAHDTLSIDFERRNIGKEYEALVEGIIKEDSGTIDLPMRLDTEHRPRQIADRKNGKQAITYWEKIRVERHDGRNVTRLRLVPRTGRTHQLRVHCSEGLGHPIVGDRLYGKADSRMMLCACYLEFTHPTAKKRMEFRVPCEF